MCENSPYKLNSFTCRTGKKGYQIYCVKFCPYTEEHIFAAAVLNRVEIHMINDGDKNMKLVKTFEAKRKDEYFYALDWTFDEETGETLLIGGGITGKIYNFHKSSVFGIEIRDKENAINDIVFSPKVEYLFAAAYEDGSVCLYNLRTETCLALCQTQRANSMKQTISVSFDPQANYIAYGGMTKEIFILNLKDSQAFQDNLKESLMPQQKIAPVKFNFLHNMCVLQNLHENYIDTINWYAENSFITKSASGDIIFWYIKGVDKQDTPFKTNNGLKVIKQHTIKIENCDLWFIRFSIDPLFQYLTIGTCGGEFIIWNLQDDSFYKLKSYTLNHTFKQSLIRHSTFSNNGKYLVCCTDNGYLVSYVKTENIVEKKTGNKKYEAAKKRAKSVFAQIVNIQSNLTENP